VGSSVPTDRTSAWNGSVDLTWGDSHIRKKTPQSSHQIVAALIALLIVCALVASIYNAPASQEFLEIVKWGTSSFFTALGFSHQKRNRL